VGGPLTARESTSPHGVGVQFPSNQDRATNASPVADCSLPERALCTARRDVESQPIANATLCQFSTTPQNVHLHRS
jgi:hypothetical protein